MSGNQGDDKDKKEKDPSRGTNDDLEILRIVLDEHPQLKMRVLDKMRVMISMSNMGKNKN